MLNRRAWDQLLAGALRKGTQPLYVALIDLDRFKDYNDRHGHPAGDALLRRAAAAGARRSAPTTCSPATAARSSRCCWPAARRTIALEIAERLRLATIDEQHVSIGVARWDGRQTAARLVERADQALYDGQARGPQPHRAGA